MHRWISGLVAATAFVACSYAIYWQVACAHAVEFSYAFASAAFAAVCIHWLLEELDLVRYEPPREAVDD